MNRLGKKTVRFFLLFFFLFNALLIVLTATHAIGDFGNYYYGSRFFLAGTEPLKFYQDIHFFNALIREYESGVFFGNYTPVPPFSLLFYAPFAWLGSGAAKLLFNLLSLVVLCWSLKKALFHFQFFSYGFYLLPFIFFQPLYSNYHQGQAYILMAALLLEFFMAWQKQQSVTAGLWLALMTVLKIFPGFMIVLLFLKKDWRTVLWTAVFFMFFQAATLALVGKDTFFYYAAMVFPRLAANDITAPFLYTNQSLHTFLLHAFVYEPYQNPSPYIHLPFISVLIQLVFYVLLFSCLRRIVKEAPLFVGFFIVLLGGILINKYVTVYSLVLLLPFMFLLKDMAQHRFLPMAFVLLLACNLPIHRLADMPLFIQYSRLWLFAILFVLLVRSIKPKIRLADAAVSLLIFIIPSLAFTRYKPLSGQRLFSHTGILYDYKLSSRGLVLYSCLGARDTSQEVPLVVGKIDSSVHVLGYSQAVIGKTVLYSSSGQLKKPLLINDTSLLVMSDERRGVGMYELLIKKIKPAHD